MYKSHYLDIRVNVYNKHLTCRSWMRRTWHKYLTRPRRALQFWFFPLKRTNSIIKKLWFFHASASRATDFIKVTNLTDARWNVEKRNIRRQSEVEISAFMETMSMSLRVPTRDHPLFASQTKRVIIISVGANEAPVFWRPPDHPRLIRATKPSRKGREGEGGEEKSGHSGRKINFTDCK